MKSTFPDPVILPPRMLPRAQQLCLWVGLGVVALGLIGSVAWAAGNPMLLRLRSDFPPIPLQSAVGLLAVGIALVALARGRAGVAVASAVLALSLGLIFVVRSSLGLVEAPLTALTTAATLSLSTAVCLMLTGSAVCLLARGRRSLLTNVAAGVAGAVVATLSGVILLSYVTGILSSLRFGLLTGMSIYGAAGLLASGLCILLVSWQHSTGPTLLPTWLPLAVGLGGLVTTVVLWKALTLQQADRLSLQARAEVDLARRDLAARFDGLLQVLSGLAVQQSMMTGAASDQGIAATRRVIQGTEGLEGLLWLERSGRVLQADPDWLAAPDFQAELSQALTGGSDSTEAIVVRLLALPPGLPTRKDVLLIAMPLCLNRRCDYLQAALLDPAAFLFATLKAAAPGFGLSVASHGHTYFRSPGMERENGLAAAHRASTVLWLGGVAFDIGLWPGPEIRRLADSDLPEVVGILGITVSGLLAFSLRQMRRNLALGQAAEQERVANALQGSADGLWERTLNDGQETLRSPTIWRRLGYEPGAGELPRWETLIHPEDLPRVNQALDQYLTGRTLALELEYRALAADGTWHWLVERGRVVERDHGGSPVRLLGVTGDVTDRTRADHAAATSEQRFRIMYNSSTQYQALVSPDCACLDANPAALEFGGIAVADIQGRKLWETPWWAGNPEREARLRQACVEAGRGSPVRYEVELQGKGDRTATVDFSLTPVFDPSGQVTQLLAEARDITERKRTEDALRELDTLSTIGRLAARVAHEINNPLAGIKNSFLLVRDAIPRSHPYYSYVGAIEREIDRIADVTRQLYETYRQDTRTTGGPPAAVVIADAISMLRQLNRGSGVSVALDVSRAELPLPVPSALLRQATYNLVQNAIEASPPGATVTVAAWPAGRYLLLSVRDQGEGVPHHIQERMFEPFLSSKGHDLRTGGLGLGLSLVRRSAEALGGRIELLTPNEGGAEFRVWIPTGRGDSA